MYFELNPKEKKDDFFNYEKQYEMLCEAIEKKDKIVVIKGVRRIGKTSLMKVVFNKIKEPKYYLDARFVEGREKELFRVLYAIFFDLIKQTSNKWKVIEKIKDISISGIGVSISSFLPEMTKIIKIFNEEIGSKQAYIFIDEAQKLKQYGFGNILAYIYDNTQNVTVVLSGSEVGVMDELLGEKEDSPLYGRGKIVIEMQRLERDKSIGFMRKGFEQLGKRVSEETINNVVDRLDGIIGWLTLYGYYYGRYGEKAMDYVISDAKKIVTKEIEEFLRNRKDSEKRYLLILKALSSKDSSWSQLKTYLELNLGVKISKSRLYNYINSLMSYGFIARKGEVYSLCDPLIRNAVEGIRFLPGTGSGPEPTTY